MTAHLCMAVLLLGMSSPKPENTAAAYDLVPASSLALHYGDLALASPLGLGAGALATDLVAFQGSPPPTTTAEQPTSAPLHPTRVRGGMGFTNDPNTFLLTAEGEHFFTDHVAVGPLVQFGISDRWVLVAPTINALYMVKIPKVDHLQVFGQGGVGFAYLSESHRPGNDGDLGFLLNVGGGLDYELDEGISVGTSLLFNILPDKVLDEHFFFTWQVLTFGVNF